MGSVRTCLANCDLRVLLEIKLNVPFLRCLLSSLAVPRSMAGEVLILLTFLSWLIPLRLKIHWGLQLSMRKLSQWSVVLSFLCPRVLINKMTSVYVRHRHCLASWEREEHSGGRALMVSGRLQLLSLACNPPLPPLKIPSASMTDNVIHSVTTKDSEEAKLETRTLTSTSQKERGHHSCWCFGVLSVHEQIEFDLDVHEYT